MQGVVVAQSPHDQGSQRTARQQNSRAHDEHLLPPPPSGSKQEKSKIGADGRQKNSSVWSQQNARRNPRSRGEPWAESFSFEVAQPDDCKIHCQSREEDLQGLRERGSRVQ